MKAWIRTYSELRRRHKVGKPENVNGRIAGKLNWVASQMATSEWAAVSEHAVHDGKVCMCKDVRHIAPASKLKPHQSLGGSNNREEAGKMEMEYIQKECVLVAVLRGNENEMSKIISA